VFEIIDEIKENLAIERDQPASRPSRGRDVIGCYDILRETAGNYGPVPTAKKYPQPNPTKGLDTTQSGLTCARSRCFEKRVRILRNGARADPRWMLN